ncbi:PAS domain-containing protein [Dactylosporangium sp. NPDC051541]|uniref:PAS domain-containing protein n=1 Tax=Dactylosporangium sp. NPDC051541 TaxID=3363977 RepID=UPI0037BDBDB8
MPAGPCRCTSRRRARGRRRTSRSPRRRPGARGRRSNAPAAEAARRESEARFRALAEASPLGVAVTTQGPGTFLYANRASKAAERARTACANGQREALEAALSGAPLEASLGCLVRGAVEALGPGTRAVFSLTGGDGVTAHQVSGGWSVPILGAAGTALGSLAIDPEPPRAPTPYDLELATMLTRTAAMIIAHRDLDIRRGLR